MSTRWDMTPQDIADTCEATAAILEGHWYRGAWYVEKKGTYCIEGALAAALGLDPLVMGHDTRERAVLRACPVYAAVQETVIQQIIRTEDDEIIDTAIRLVEDDGLPYWNDLAYREEQEVLDVLHTTAKRVLGVGPDDS